MKLSRRCFLSFVVGGAAGTTLSPLPWKLLDDISIWSQNWPWIPVPPDGESTYVRSTCTLCPGGCGISVRKIDDRVVKIEGVEKHPVNNGGMCMLGLSGAQLLYSPSRVKTPLKRVGDRGEGRWEPISWEAAIGEVADNLADIRRQGNPQSVACMAPTDKGTVARLIQRLMAAYGSPNFIRMPSVEDAYESMLRLTQGLDGQVGVDVETADLILSFGCALLDGYRSPVRMIQANSRWKSNHAKLIQIEPRLSNTAAKADKWVAPTPGSEADLALAIAQVIISRKKYNHAYVAENTEGLEALTRILDEKYNPEIISGPVGLEVETIIDLAFQFAKAKRPLALLGRGKGQMPGSLKEALAVQTLNTLMGNINQPGGVFSVAEFDYIQWPHAEQDGTAATGLQTPRMDGAGTTEYPHVRFLANRFIEKVNSGAAKAQALLVADANPCYSLPDTAAVKAAFEKIPFVVSFSSFMDETAMNADLILPSHFFLERYEDVAISSGLIQQAVGLCRPVVAPLYDTRHPGDSIIRIARGIGGSVSAAFPWKDYETCLKETLGSKWRALDRKGLWMAPVDDQETASLFGKTALMSGDLGAVLLAETAMPEGDAGNFPLLLVPYDSIRLAGHQVGNTPFMTKTVADTVLKGRDGLVELNPETADMLGLAEGQAARLSTPKGEARVRIHLCQGTAPGVIALPRGLGHHGDDPYLAGKGVNVNQLVGPVRDTSSGLDAAWGIRAKLVKA
jgi:anaerobic selenocysteine-containing dehydrogenase